MVPFARLTLALIGVLAVAAAADARPIVRPGAPRPVLRVQLGRQAGGSQTPFRPLQLNAIPRKAQPSPAPAPEFNPLKRRRMAMPALAPDAEYAF